MIPIGTKCIVIRSGRGYEGRIVTVIGHIIPAVEIQGTLCDHDIDPDFEIPIYALWAAPENWLLPIGHDPDKVKAVEREVRV